MQPKELLNWIARIYLFVILGNGFIVFVSNFFLGTQIDILQPLFSILPEAAGAYVLYGVPIAAVVVLLTTEPLNKEVRKWKKYCWIALGVVSIPFVLDVIAPRGGFGMEGLGAVYGIVLFGIPFLLICFAALLVEENKAKKSRR